MIKLNYSVNKKIISLLENYFLPFSLIFLFFIIYAKHSIIKHLTFNSSGFDLGIYSQITYLYSQGLTPFSTLKHMPLLADHFGPILWLLSPIYKLIPSPITLLVIQALFVSLSGIFIYLIAKDKLKNTFTSLLITIAYLSFPGVLSAINFDFHLASISVLPLSIILYAWNFHKQKLYWSAIILSLFFKEDIPIFILGLGIYQLIFQQKKLGVATIITASISVYLIKFHLMPFIWSGAEKGYLTTSILPLDSPIDLISLLLTRPNIYLTQIFNSPLKIQTLEFINYSFGFLPLLSPLSWLSTFPYLYLRFSSTYQAQWTNYFHHNINLAPFLVMSSILAINYFHIPKKAVIILILFSIFTGGLSMNSFIWSTFSLNYPQTHYYQKIEKYWDFLPNNAAISAQSPLVPHLANRENIFMFPEINGGEYIVLDTSLNSYPMDKIELLNKIQVLKRSPSWKIEKEEGSFIIFHQNEKY